MPIPTLYDDNKVLEALLQGDVDLAAPSLSKFEKFTKQFRIFDLPFMFENIEAVDAFQASEAGQELLDSMHHRGLQGLTFWHNGMKQMSANVPLMAPSDADGLKFRVMSSDVLVAQMEAIGGSPQKMAFSEVYGALQQSVVDGQENTWANTYGKKFFEVQDRISETNHGIIDYLVVTSVDWLSLVSLPVSCLPHCQGHLLQQLLQSLRSSSVVCARSGMPRASPQVSFVRQLGTLIRPSIVMVVYAASVEVSVGRMFLAGVIPGLLAGFMLMTTIYIIAKFKNLPKGEWQNWC